MGRQPMLDEKIIAKLEQPLDASRVKHRAGGGGMSLAYLKGHNVIDQANDTFGFGAWGYDILLVELCNVIAEDGQIIGGYYAARVRLTVRDCMPITEEGVCPIQEGRNPRAKIDAHDMARKGAVTDAMKRAFRCYGDQFGNSLYDTDLIDGQPKPEGQQQRQQPTTQPTSRPATQQAPSANRTTQPAPTPLAARPAPAPVTAPAVAPNPAPKTNELATDQQITAIAKMAGRKGVDDIQLNDRLTELYGVELKSLSKSDASHFIKVFQEQA